MARIGIRREDKNHWEARTPLVPADVARLTREHGLDITVQRSPIRVFKDGEYDAAGAAIANDLTDCPIIMGVKEIPPSYFESDKTYVFFSHVIKGQTHNMPMLRRLMDLRCQVIDYEKIADDQGRRLVFFGRFAGLAGMIDTLWALGRRLKHEGSDTPFAAIQPSHRYRDLDHIKDEFRKVGEQVRRVGLPAAIQPFVCGFAGYGQVSQGAQEIFDLLPVEEVGPDDLASVKAVPDRCYKVVFHEEHMVRRGDPSSPFELQEYYDHPERYRADFFRFIPYLTVLINCIYWEPRYPQFVSREQLRELFAGPQPPRLRVVGDITADTDGALACTPRVTTPDNPVYVYDPATGETRDGVEGDGVVVQAVDFLPCELPVDASNAFSQAMMPFMPALAAADFTGMLKDSGLPQELVRATIVYQGQLTGPYKDLEHYLSK